MVTKHHLEALKIIYDRLADGAVTWVVTGSLGMALVKIMGALQKRITGQGWEEPVEVAPHRQFVNVGGMKVPVLSLVYEQEAYLKLGRVERAAAIGRWLLGE